MDSDYSVFLDSWFPSDQLNHACMDAYVNDPVMEKRLSDDLSGSRKALRTKYAPGRKLISKSESAIRGMDFIVQNQANWSDEFDDYVTSKGINSEKMRQFYEFFREHWIDGNSRRQKNRMALSIKRSIFDYDMFHYGPSIQDFVVNAASPTSEPFFTIEEMGIIFDANTGLLEARLSEYIDHLNSDVLSTFTDLYIRRGVHMRCINTFRIELNHLSSYSLALGPVEQFAQTYSRESQGTGIPSIFSAPIPAVQNRTVAFAPFIPEMPINQFEIIVAPPIEKTSFLYHQIHGDIHEFEFR